MWIPMICKSAKNLSKLRIKQVHKKVTIINPMLTQEGCTDEKYSHIFFWGWSGQLMNRPYKTDTACSKKMWYIFKVPLPLWDPDLG